VKGITTIAALPNGAGQAAHLKAEVGEAKPVLAGIDYASGGPDTTVIRIITQALTKAMVKQIDREMMALFNAPARSTDMLDTSK
jgi:hypothetical protein